MRVYLQKLLGHSKLILWMTDLPLRFYRDWNFYIKKKKSPLSFFGNSNLKKKKNISPLHFCLETPILFSAWISRQFYVSFFLWDTKRSANVGTLPFWWWANTGPALGRCLVLAGDLFMLICLPVKTCKKGTMSLLLIEYLFRTCHTRSRSFPDPLNRFRVSAPWVGPWRNGRVQEEPWWSGSLPRWSVCVDGGFKMFKTSLDILAIIPAKIITGSNEKDREHAGKTPGRVRESSGASWNLRNVREGPCVHLLRYILCFCCCIWQCRNW